MARSGKISPIKKEYSQNFLTIDSSLAKHGFVRAPGTGRLFLPYRERTGLYRTGLDENAQYLQRLKDLSPEQYEAEVKRIREDKARLEAKLGCKDCLSPSSKFYDVSSNENIKAYPVKLGSTDKYFDFSDVMEEITWNWMKVYPMIAPSLEAYMRGDASSECQYYVCDDQAETKLAYNKKKEINSAIAAFEKMEPSKKKRVARLMGLGVNDDTPEEEVYNIMDSTLKEMEFKSGKFQGTSTVRMFNEIANLTDSRLKVKDIIEQALTKNIYRERANGRIYEGEMEIARNKEELITSLLEDEHQEDLIILEKKLKGKKLAEI